MPQDDAFEGFTREKPRLVLFQPDIPQNTGTLLRMGACLDVAVEIIEPCGFILDDKRLRRAGMDYLSLADLRRHPSWDAYQTQRAGRLILLTTKAQSSLYDFAFQPGDHLLLGRESSGAPEEVHAAADARVKIPMAPGARSLNIALAGAMALGEALRQLSAWPSPVLS